MTVLPGNKLAEMSKVRKHTGYVTDDHTSPKRHFHRCVWLRISMPDGGWETKILGWMGDGKEIEFIKLRASQINRCANCVELHANTLHKLGLVL